MQVEKYKANKGAKEMKEVEIGKRKSNRVASLRVKESKAQKK
ncbi:hypothetical protein QP042_01270 (plasmid) [Bacillus bombysepticus]|nr:hypothetical protein QP042_01270 [Bacillus bombysepticus]